ncbi:MAG: slipin family protein [Nitrososphaerota archaeon]|jgi:regulator of protease activity HflC (stomatin/prohibitin superfamily)|nr:slipin family protein [Nitrososphaerota archaeon]MDG7037687.1 slipin family protein [Nitrososphaerota archaeon]
MSDILLYFSIFIIVVVVGVFLSGLHILREWERAPVLTLGRFMGIKGPGLVYVFPFISKMPTRISTRLQVYSFVTEQTLTKDNVPVDVDAVMYFMPADVQKSVLSVENYRAATEYAAQTTLREVVGQTVFDELLAEREKIGTIVRGIIDEKTESWGIKVTAVEVRDLKIPSSLQAAMSAQAQAERERRARVTLALAESQAAEKMVQAADQYKNNELAFQLRWMNMLYELGLRSNSSLVMIPSNIPTAGLSPLGLFDVKDLMAKGSKKKEQEEKGAQQ